MTFFQADVSKKRHRVRARSQSRSEPEGTCESNHAPLQQLLRRRQVKMMSHVEVFHSSTDFRIVSASPNLPY